MVKEEIEEHLITGMMKHLLRSYSEEKHRI